MTATGPADLTSLTREEISALTSGLGQPKYRGAQLYRWLFARMARSIDEMSDLPAAFRAELASGYVIGWPVEVRRDVAKDGTIKLLMQLTTGRKVETVLIPDLGEDGTAERLTVCVSSQVGCAMGCSFCATGRMGFSQNLHAGEIYGQVAHLDRVARETYGRGVTNVVYMGMGEPLQNYEQVKRSVALLADPDTLGIGIRRITVSTVGLASRIRKFADDGIRASLAVSLHAPDDVKRSSIMPVNRSVRTDLDALKDAITHYTTVTGRRITYEYCMFRGFNDTVEDARNLVSVARWAPCKVNLIMYNPVPGLGFDRTEEAQLDRFIRVLVAAGVTVTVRRSRGQDIAAACGQLAATEA